jgi:hypothetical protein
MIVPMISAICMCGSQIKTKAVSKSREYGNKKAVGVVGKPKMVEELLRVKREWRQTVPHLSG